VLLVIMTIFMGHPAEQASIVLCVAERILFQTTDLDFMYVKIVETQFFKNNLGSSVMMETQIVEMDVHQPAQ